MAINVVFLGPALASAELEFQNWSMIRTRYDFLYLHFFHSGSIIADVAAVDFLRATIYLYHFV